MSINLLRQLSDLDSLKHINKVAKNTEKLLKLQDFNPWRQIWKFRFLFVSVTLVKIRFHSDSFHVNDVIKTTFESQLGPQASRFQFILQTFGIKTHDDTSKIQQWKTHALDDYKLLNNKIAIK